MRNDQSYPADHPGNGNGCRRRERRQHDHPPPCKVRSHPHGMRLIVAQRKCIDPPAKEREGSQRQRKRPGKPAECRRVNCTEAPHHPETDRGERRSRIGHCNEGGEECPREAGDCHARENQPEQPVARGKKRPESKHQRDGHQPAPERGELKHHHPGPRNNGERCPERCPR